MYKKYIVGYNKIDETTIMFESNTFPLEIEWDLVLMVQEPVKYSSLKIPMADR